MKLSSWLLGSLTAVVLSACGGGGGGSATSQCGDGYLDAGELCDDGNTTSGDGCSSTCQPEDLRVCGDGSLAGNEECDDGNTTDGDGGAIYADRRGDVTIVDSTVDGSTADGPGGAVFTLDGDVTVVGSTLNGNRADDRGGAISDPQAAAGNLGTTVEVIRDDRGVPQIYAEDAESLFRGQGYVHAQDRFFEMDLRRHITAGRLSELVGENEDALRALAGATIALAIALVLMRVV